MELSRRGLLGIGLAGVFGGAGGLGGRLPAQATGRRPNIVWVISEDNNPSLGCYGDPIARTPRLDALAAAGTRFDTAYCTTPVCAPSRFTLLTGVHAESVGPAHHHRASATLPDGFVGFPALLRRAGYYCTNNSKTDYNADIDLTQTWDESSPTAHWRNRPSGAPFFAQITLMTTHESRLFKDTPPTTSPADVRVPPHLPDSPAVREDIARYYDNLATMDTEVARIMGELADDGLTDDTIVCYFGDNGGCVAGSKRSTNNRGLHVPLIMQFGRHWRRLAPSRPGGSISRPVSQVDLPATALSLAGLPVPSHMHGRRIAGRSPQRRQYAFGQRGRMDERYDLQRAVRDERYLYVRNYLPHRPYGQHNVYMWQAAGCREWERQHLAGTLNPVQDRFWQEKPCEELYDLSWDEDEVHNLADSPTHQGVRKRLSRALDSHILAVNDNGFLPEGSAAEGYLASREPHAYPLRRVVAVAATAAQRDPRNLRRLIGWLGDRDPTVRFWAAQGALGLGAHARRCSDELARRFREDDDPNVRIVLAEALARLDRPDDAVAFLATTARGAAQVPLRLQAIDALTYVGGYAKPYRDAIRAAAESPETNVSNAARYLLLVVDGTYDPEVPIGQAA